MTKKAAIIAIDIRSGAELTGKKNVSEAKIGDKKKRLWKQPLWCCEDG